ncbi:helix-turn-helix transcriptional regulator [Methylocella sp. CPCC 101449]|nr:helix-turn-helix transcriptional regulator [Methylocella sp. CPCC 101449]
MQGCYKVDISAAQCRGARAMVGWSQDQLADASGVAKATIANFEAGKRAPYSRTLSDLQRALEAAGVIFVAENGEGPGVRLKKGASLDARIADAKERASEQIPDGASPASGMAKLRRGKAEADLRNLKQKKRQKDNS